MTLPLMPKATAVWLVDNTSLDFEQIANFCGMHYLEIQGIADGEVAVGIQGNNPIAARQLTAEEIQRCEADPKSQLKLQENTRNFIDSEKSKKKKSRYTPVARRQDKPDAIAWIIKNCPGTPDSQITKLIGTTKKTIESIRDKSHWNYSNLTPRDPVLLGLCLQKDLDIIIEAAKKRQEEEQDKAS